MICRPLVAGTTFGSREDWGLPAFIVHWHKQNVMEYLVLRIDNNNKSTCIDRSKGIIPSDNSNTVCSCPLIPTWIGKVVCSGTCLIKLKAGTTGTCSLSAFLIHLASCAYLVKLIVRLN